MLSNEQSVLIKDLIVLNPNKEINSFTMESVEYSSTGIFYNYSIVLFNRTNELNEAVTQTTQTIDNVIQHNIAVILVN